MRDHTTPFKCCTKCKQDKPRNAEYFMLDNRASDGLASCCRECNAMRSREYYKTHREQSKQQLKRWRNSHPEQSKAQSKRYREKHPDTFKKCQRNYYYSHQDQMQQRTREYRKDNPSYARDYAKRYARTHRLRRRELQAIREARKKALPATLTLAEWEQIKAEWGYTCAYCGKPWFELDTPLEQDHVIPVKQGGGYTADNIVPSCKSCNCKKQGRTPEQARMRLRKRS